MLFSASIVQVYPRTLVLLLEWPLATTLVDLLKQRAHFAAIRAVVLHRLVVLDANDLALLIT